MSGIPAGEATPATGRRLPLQAGPPGFNMALDQALLEAVDRGGPPVLRFYRWSEPTLSLGYFQSVRARETHAASQPLAAVRRATGGGAIVHHHELTYSLAVRPAGTPIAARQELYRSVHASIAETLARRGIAARPHAVVGGPLGQPEAFLCFRRRTDEDLVVCGYKIVGSAQRRGRKAILQHGSLLLRASPFAAELPGLEDLLSAAGLDPLGLSEAIASELGSRLAIRWETGTVTATERARAEQIDRERFSSAAWWLRR